METEIAPTDSAALYRNATTVSQPIIDHKHLQFINTWNDERILLGASNLNGRFWNGSTWLYDECSTFEKSQAVVCANTESVVCDGDFIEREKFFIVEDSGVLQIFEVVENPNSQSRQIQCLGYTCQHDDSILSCSIFDEKNRLVTGGMDRCLKVWNLSDLIAEHSYDGAHSKIISCVDAKPKNNDLFASSSLDSEAVVWDVRQVNPAQVAYSQAGRQLLAVAWSPEEENILVAGSIDGSVLFIDVRKPRQLLKDSSVFKKSIHKMKFDRKRPHLLATCSEDIELKVLDTTENISTIYQDKRHTDFVRGIAWYNENLLSCSWDNTVLKHEIPTVPDNENCRMECVKIAASRWGEKTATDIFRGSENPSMDLC